MPKVTKVEPEICGFKCNGVEVHCARNRCDSRVLVAIGDCEIYLTANKARAFAHWLTTAADEVDKTNELLKKLQEVKDGNESGSTE